MNIDKQKLNAFYEAYSYGHVTPRAWLYKQFMEIKAVLVRGEAISVDEDCPTTLLTEEDFYGWALRHFPEFKDDQLHDIVLSPSK